MLRVEVHTPRSQPLASLVSNPLHKEYKPLSGKGEQAFHPQPPGGIPPWERCPRVPRTGRGPPLRAAPSCEGPHFGDVYSGPKGMVDTRFVWCSVKVKPKQSHKFLADQSQPLGVSPCDLPLGGGNLGSKSLMFGFQLYTLCLCPAYTLSYPGGVPVRIRYAGPFLYHLPDVSWWPNWKYEMGGSLVTSSSE